MEPVLLASFAAALVVFGVVSRRMERGVVSPPMVFVGLGKGVGAAAGTADPTPENRPERTTPKDDLPPSPCHCAARPGVAATV